MNWHAWYWWTWPAAIALGLGFNFVLWYVIPPRLPLPWKRSRFIPVPDKPGGKK